MKSATPAALVTAGGVNRSFLARMPTVLATLGAVKASSFRVARRISNSLHAGHAAKEYRELDDAQLIWIAVPEAALDQIIGEVAAGVRVKDKMVVLCECRRDSASPLALRTGGALIATLNSIAPDGKTLLAEGNPAVLRELQRIAFAEKRKLIRVRPAAKPLYFAGTHLASLILLPWMAGAVESFRAAGFSRNDATQVAELLGARWLKAYGKSGRKAWSRAAALTLMRSLEQDMEAIRAANPSVSSLYSAGVAQALRYFDAAK